MAPSQRDSLAVAARSLIALAESSGWSLRQRVRRAALDPGAPGVRTPTASERAISPTPPPTPVATSDPLIRRRAGPTAPEAGHARLAEALAGRDRGAIGEGRRSGRGVLDGCLDRHSVLPHLPPSQPTVCKAIEPVIGARASRTLRVEASRDERSDGALALLPAGIFSSTVQLGALIHPHKRPLRCLGKALL
jgi:hypothetical protein